MIRINLLSERKAAGKSSFSFHGGQTVTVACSVVLVGTFGVIGWRFWTTFPVVITKHAMGRMRPQDSWYVPKNDLPRIYNEARIMLAVYGIVAGVAIWFGSFAPLVYWLIPRIYGRTQMFSPRLVNVHFWIATIGIVLYIASMWIAGVMQGLMWRAVNPDGTLTWTFAESVKATYPFYVVRLLGGLLYLSGMCLMAWNVVMTVRVGRPASHPIPGAAFAAAA